MENGIIDLHRNCNGGAGTFSHRIFLWFFPGLIVCPDKKKTISMSFVLWSKHLLLIHVVINDGCILAARGDQKSDNFKMMGEYISSLKGQFKKVQKGLA